MDFKQRTESGMSLPTIIGLGLIASFWMLGTASLVVPATNRLTLERAMDLTRCSAEAGLDYALQKVNDPTTRTAMLATSTWTIPSTIMADYDSTKSPATRMSGSITIANVRPPSTKAPNTNAYTSYLYDGTVDDQQASSYFYNGGAANNTWRVLTATVNSGTISRAVRVILKPVIGTTSTTTNVQVNGTPTPIFKFTAFGIGSIGVGNGNANSYDSNGNSTTMPSTFQTIANGGSGGARIADDPNNPTPGYGDVASNGTITMGPNANIGGNVESWGPSTSTNVVNGGGTVNGVVDAAAISGVTGEAGNSTTATPTSQEIPPMKPEPSTFTSAPGNVSSISLSGNKTLTLTAGNYKFNSISVTGNGKLIIDNSAGPVNIWVGGTNSSIAIAGNGVANTTGVAANLAVWYEGSSNVTVAGNGAFNGVIWAANAPVDINGNGGYYGAVLGNTINFSGNNATFHYDRNLLGASSLMYTPLVNKSVTTTIQSLQNFQAVSWHEYNPNSPF